MSFQCPAESCSFTSSTEPAVKAHYTKTHVDDEELLQECEECEEEFKVPPHKGERRFCSDDCFREWEDRQFGGENARPSDKNRNPIHQYGREWPDVRERVISRDSGKCQFCGFEGQLSVHHILRYHGFDAADKDKANDCQNLVSLCSTCHGKFERVFAMPVLLDDDDGEPGELPDGRISYVDDFHDPVSMFVDALEETDGGRGDDRREVSA